MRFLADENFPRAAIELLRESGHDVEWVRASHPGIGDEQIIDLARHHQQIVITFDQGFGDLVFRWNIEPPPGIVMFRIRATHPARMIERIATSIDARNDWLGHFSVIEQDKIRMRPMPDR